MFTGIITDIGTIVAVDGGRYTIASHYQADTIALGASIACDGCCLTVTSLKATADGAMFTVDVSNESLSKTTLGSWRAQHAINLERALKAGDELGGHIVSGHVDGVATIVDIRRDGESQRFTIETPSDLARFVAPKGSVTLDGTSLTVNEVNDQTNGRAHFGINLIPHTLTATTWGRKRVGDQVNMEIDMLARYMARLVGR
jgi:riboflavin synthase